MTSAYWGIVVILVAVVLALAGQVLVQRSVPLPLRESHNTAIGMIYAALYVMYALSLAFSLFIVWTIHLIEYPFTSDVQVSPAPFESVSHHMAEMINNEPSR